VNPILTVIPTTGAPELRQAVESALPSSDVLLVSDTPGGSFKAGGETMGLECAGLTHLYLPFRVGGGEWAGHRIYAAVPHLVNHEFVAFLDEDNWYAPEHLPAMLDVLHRPAEAAYSYRRIVDKDGSFVCNDECESLGPHDRGIGGRFLVDTSCWAFRRSWLESHAHWWNFGWGADAHFTMKMRNAQQDAAATHLFSVNYRLGSSERSPKAEFFINGNRRMLARGAPVLPLPRP
jgi:hypothetical protein